MLCIESGREIMNATAKRLNDKVTLNAEDKRLRPLFDEMTADLNHWKNPFTCVVPVDKFADYCAAAVFYTGSELVKVLHTVATNGFGKDKVFARCAGYYGGPAAG